MYRKILVFILIEALACQVFAANFNLTPALKQYILSSLGSSQPTTRQALPVTISKTAQPNFQSLAALASLLASSGNPTYAPPPQKPPSTSSILTSLSESPNGGVDSSLLNNLAMALQLLIVSNLLSSPQESTPEPVASPGYYEVQDTVQQAPVTYASYPQQVASVQKPQTQSYQYEQIQSYQPAAYQPPSYQPQQMSMPNSNFVGSSTFGDPFMGSVPPASGLSSSRSGFTLMSPYEALSPSSPFSDPILSSPYGSIMTSKKDFQSPYAAMMAADNKDLFSMSDFF